MFSRELQRVCKRLAILGLLVACGLFLVLTDNNGSVVNAARCIEDCETSFGLCTDSCATSCDENATDEDCRSCIQSCHTQHYRCFSGAIS